MNKYLFQRAGCIFSKNLIQKFSIMLNKLLIDRNKLHLNTIPIQFWSNLARKLCFIVVQSGKGIKHRSIC